MLNKIKLIIFDLDGTLADTLWEIRDAMNAALGAYGLPTVNYSAVKRGINNGPRNLCLAMLPEDRREDSAFVDEFLARYHEEYGKIYENRFTVLALAKSRGWEKDAAAVSEFIEEKDGRSIRKIGQNDAYRLIYAFIASLEGCDFKILDSAIHGDYSKNEVRRAPAYWQKEVKKK